MDTGHGREKDSVVSVLETEKQNKRSKFEEEYDEEEKKKKRTRGACADNLLF